jgi:hypothetical protein
VGGESLFIERKSRIFLVMNDSGLLFQVVLDIVESTNSEDA